MKSRFSGFDILKTILDNVKLVFGGFLFLMDMDLIAQLTSSLFAISIRLFPYIFLLTPRILCNSLTLLFLSHINIFTSKLSISQHALAVLISTIPSFYTLLRLQSQTFRKTTIGSTF